MVKSYRFRAAIDVEIITITFITNAKESTATEVVKDGNSNYPSSSIPPQRTPTVVQTFGISLNLSHGVIPI